MRQDHCAGEKRCVDYAGHTAEAIDRATGEMRPAQIFVAVMGASNYTCAEASWSQQLVDWIGALVRALTSWVGAGDRRAGQAEVGGASGYARVRFGAWHRDQSPPI